MSIISRTCTPILKRTFQFVRTISQGLRMDKDVVNLERLFQMFFIACVIVGKTLIVPRSVSAPSGVGRTVPRWVSASPAVGFPPHRYSFPYECR